MKNEYETIIKTMVSMLEKDPVRLIDLTKRLDSNMSDIEKNFPSTDMVFNLFKREDLFIDDAFLFASLRSLFFEKLADISRFSKYIVDIYKETKNEND